MEKLNIVICWEKFCASENANFHQPLVFKRQPAELFFSRKTPKVLSMYVSIESSIELIQWYLLSNLSRGFWNLDFEMKKNWFGREIQMARLVTEQSLWLI